MKMAAFFMVLALVGAIFFTFLTFANEMNVQYGNENNSINTTAWDNEYDYEDSLNSTIGPLKSRWDLIEDDNKGFFTRISAGITAIPYVLILVPSALFQGITTGSALFVGFFTALAIPGKIISITVLILLMWAVFKLVEQWRGSTA
jgi:uncharacterized membrane protein